MAEATLAGGCFWCLEAVFTELRGVQRVRSGYAGGTVPDPSYEAVCRGTTGHAEVVQVSYDPEQIGYRDLLDVFFSIHDPTSLDRQGADVGTQYRSAIFWHDAAQEAIARTALAEVAPLFERPVVTTIEPLATFYPADSYHQDFFARNPSQPYCAAVVAPKVAKFRAQHLARLRR